MKVASLSARLLELPYKRPLITASNRFDKARGLLVEAISDKGVVGFGYADLFPRTGETVGSASHAVERVLKHIIEGRELHDIGKIKLEMDRVLTGNPRVKSAVETALYDLLARQLQIPLCLLWGGAVKAEMRIIRFVGLSEPEVMAEDACRLVAEGFTALKLKINGDPDLDADRVTRVRDAVGEGVFIKVDANEAYDAKTAIRLAGKLADLNVDTFEQPVPRGQFEALREIKMSTPLRIEADQSANSVYDVYRLIALGAVDSVNTSLQKAGGFSEVRRLAELCSLAGVSCHLGNTAGTMVGDAAALHLAAASSAISPLCELGEFESVADDPFHGLKITQGMLSLPKGAGLGVAPK